MTCCDMLSASTGKNPKGLSCSLDMSALKDTMTASTNEQKRGSFKRTLMLKYQRRIEKMRKIEDPTLKVNRPHI